MNKLYYKIKYQLASPLSIGGSDNYMTNRDVICDKYGNPFIPATSLCGVYRTYFDEETANKLFGNIGNTQNGFEIVESSVKVYDGYLVSENDYAITIRDNNKIKDENDPKDIQNKFDAQIVEVGAEFVSYIEVDMPEYESNFDDMLNAINYGDLRFGAKTSRGFGKVKICECKKMSFAKPNEWLDFDMYDDNCWSGAQSLSFENAQSKYNTLLLELELTSGISVREYTTGAYWGFNNKREKEIITGPDYTQLKSRSKKTEYANKPVIPATSWAGVFRRHCEQFVSKDEIAQLFGFADNDRKWKSHIVFSESYIDNSISKIITRNSIDRFSAATKNGALYTEDCTFYGDLQLEIKIEKGCNCDLTPVAICVLDLGNGLLNVGGLKSVGRGIFKIKSATFNNQDISDCVKDNDLKALTKMLEEA